jgi:glutamate N-acetyltransferase/amino-acid N-acetyltransferase
MSVETSFNCLTVDGDSSTNDSVIILANGASGHPQLEADSADVKAFQQALDFVTTSLAKQIAADGEGATKFMEITVRGARSFEDARQVAKTIANSPLVKTAMFGRDPNWGRVLAAAGRAGIDFDPADVELSFGPVTIIKGGQPAGFVAEQALVVLSRTEIPVLLKIGEGSGSATVWTCDLSYDYVRINAEYHT